jgi:hypothetical protein
MRRPSRHFPTGVRFPGSDRALVPLGLALAGVLGGAPLTFAEDTALRIQDEVEEVPASYAQPMELHDLYEKYGWNVGAPPTSPSIEVHESEMLEDAYFDDSTFDYPLAAIRRPLDRLYEYAGLRLSAAYTVVNINSFDGEDTLSGFGGDLDLMARWDVVGRGTENVGRLFFTVESRDAIGHRAPNRVGPETGTLQNITNGWNDRGWVIRDFHYIQRLYEGKLRLALGRGDVGDAIGGHWLGSKNNAFFNRAFSANSTIAFPGHGAFTGFSIRPNDWFFITGAVSDAYGDTEELSLSTVDEGDYFYSGEIGVTPHIQGLGYGRYRVLAWQMDERGLTGIPGDNGIQITLEQEFGETVLGFVRGGFSDEALTNIERSIEGGVGFRGLFGAEGNMTGLAAAVSSPDPEELEERLLRYVRIDTTADPGMSIHLPQQPHPIGSVRTACRRVEGDRCRGRRTDRLRHGAGDHPRDG